MNKRNNSFNQKKTIDFERFITYEKSIKNSERLLETLKRTKNGRSICDIGGGSGYFLDKVLKKFPKIKAYNLELLKEYRKKQVNSKIKFVEDSILNHPFKENYFDIVSFRHVLHHLVSKDLKETKLNQEKALEEIFRITKPGGLIIFEEEVNQRPLFSRIIFHLSKWANRLGINNKTFSSGKVIVYFMDSAEIESIIKNNSNKFKLKIIKNKFKRWSLPLRWKITLLMGNVGHVLYVIKKLK